MRSKRENLRFIEDLSRVASGALGALGDARTQIRTLVRDRVDRVLAEMDLVTREEFDTVEAMLAKARTRQEELEKRLAALEGKKKTAARATAKKAATKKKPAKTGKKTTKTAKKKTGKRK